jgi:hypothetical protein
MVIVGKNVNPDTEFKDKLSNFQTVDFNIIQNETLNQNINNNMTIFKNNTINETNNNENKQNINNFQYMENNINCNMFYINYYNIFFIDIY